MSCVARKSLASPARAARRHSFGLCCRRTYPCLYPCHRPPPFYHDHALCPTWARRGAHEQSCAGCNVGGGNNGTAVFCLWRGGAPLNTLERIGTPVPPPPFPPPQFASRPGPPAARAVFRAGGECPSSGCVMSQQKDYNLLGGVAGILTHAFTLAIVLPLLTMTMSFALFGHTGAHRVTFRRAAARWGGGSGLVAFCFWWRLGAPSRAHWNALEYDALPPN